MVRHPQLPNFTKIIFRKVNGFVRKVKPNIGKQQNRKIYKSRKIEFLLTQIDVTEILSCIFKKTLFKGLAVDGNVLVSTHFGRMSFLINKFVCNMHRRSKW